MRGDKRCRYFFRNSGSETYENVKVYCVRWRRVKNLLTITSNLGLLLSQHLCYIIFYFLLIYLAKIAVAKNSRTENSIQSTAYYQEMDRFCTVWC